jgi:hypothetical protein
VVEGGASSLEKLARDHQDDERFLELLAQYEGQGRRVNNSRTANNYAPKQFSNEKKDGARITVARFEQAMLRLFEARKIHVSTYGPPSREHTYLALGAKGGV